MKSEEVKNEKIKFEYNTDLSLFDYLVLVEELAKEYFSEDNVYRPHYGLVNAMRLFYNCCVTDSPYEETLPHTISDPVDMIDLVADKEFIAAFNDAITIFHGDDDTINFNFANAYEEAMDIVYTKKDTIGNATDIIASAAKKLFSTLNNFLTQDNIDLIKDMVDLLMNGTITEDGIVDAYRELFNKNGGEPLINKD